MPHLDINCSIIFDAVDQSAFGIPSFCQKNYWDQREGHKNKSRLRARTPQAKLNTVSYTVRRTRDWLYSHCQNIAYIYHRSGDPGWLSSTFYIRIDNCPRENKNRFFCVCRTCRCVERLLNHWGVLLLVGHMHKDNGQAFSKTLQRLWSTNAFRMSDLYDALRNAYHGQANILRMRYVPSESGLCKSDRVLREFRAFTLFRHFWFTSQGANERRVDGMLGRYKVTVDAVDEWISLVASQRDTYSFLAYVPGLRCASATTKSYFRWRIDVTKTMEPKEERTKNGGKLKDVLMLRDESLITRVNAIH